ncbi:hypothetical protein BP5796_04977 [Coleophoma crateriformis]|uniref:Heterokaryon incompatibility domain-containing protein n=1 Tax=Coleophoma crateriformis TaxID=565419 RepID=A0A3D8SB05_9HELO|nr:hypothetical protein BP5796_04977 [Coleophoma crateriformis]
MLDDTRDCASVSHIQFSSNVEEILKFQTHRGKAIRWAKNLRFLSFEQEPIADAAGIVADEEIINVSKKGRCTRCELRVPLPAGHICNSHTGNANKTAVLAQDQNYKGFPDPCPHVINKVCGDCQHIPLFPTKKRATKFRIRRLRPKDSKTSELHHCTHFLAVSYCWQDSKRTTDPSVEPYDVIEEDGSTRKVRAPKDVIDRAVDFAAQNGYRMIWIDQECIDQDDGPEKELGIQSMDIVYQRAHMSIGLFRTTFVEQRHLDALLLFFEMLVGTSFQKRGPHPLRACRSLRLEVLAEALKMILEDRWNTRGWILQEAFSASGRMTILFPASKGTNVKGWSLVCHDLSLTELAIQLDVLRSCLAKSREMILARDFKLNVPDWDKTMESLRWFHPVEQPSHSFDFWINGDKTKRSCNAAVALSFLRTRYNDRIADRVAIVANLCDYSLRLNTVKLHETEHSLSLCIYVLALLNGDFSLLPPETYSIPRNIKIDQLQSNHEFSWINTSLKPLQYIDATIFNPSGPTVGRNTSNLYHISRNGFTLPGSLWKIDIFIELAHIKYRYCEAWERLRAPYKTRKTRTSRKGRKSNGPPPTSRSHWLATTHILFEILISLRDSGHADKADAIWQSVMNPHWMKKQGDPIESVLDFPRNLKLENRQDMFDIEANKQEGGFHPWWLIDRVMSAGGIWFAKAEKVDGTLFEPKPQLKLEAIKGVEAGETKAISNVQSNASNEPDDEQLQVKSNVANDILLEVDEVGPSVMPVANSTTNLLTKLDDARDTGSKQRLAKMKKGGHARKQFTAAMLVKLTQTVGELDDFDDDIGNEGANDLYLMTAEAMTSLARTIVYHEDIDQDDKPEYAVFDIEGNTDGTVLVLTPFNDLLETIPRPESRSMSTSWVVENVPDAKPIGDKEYVNETLRATGMIIPVANEAYTIPHG